MEWRVAGWTRRIVLRAKAHRHARAVTRTVRHELRPRPAMTTQEEIVAIRNRIAEAETDRDNWRAAGLKEQYVEAFLRVEALELQLDLRLHIPGS